MASGPIDRKHLYQLSEKLAFEGLSFSEIEDEMKKHTTHIDVLDEGLRHTYSYIALYEHAKQLKSYYFIGILVSIGVFTLGLFILYTSYKTDASYFRLGCGAIVTSLSAFFYFFKRFKTPLIEYKFVKNFLKKRRFNRYGKVFKSEVRSS